MQQHIVLSQSDAKRIGIDIDSLAFAGRASTANGVVKTARTTLDTIEIANIVDRDVSAVVNKVNCLASFWGLDTCNAGAGEKLKTVSSA